MSLATIPYLYPQAYDWGDGPTFSMRTAGCDCCSHKAEVSTPEEAAAMLRRAAEALRIQANEYDNMADDIDDVGLSALYE